MDKNSVEKILSDAKRLRVKVSKGTYDDSDLARLSRLLTDLEAQYKDVIILASGKSNVSESVLNRIKNGETRPKLWNFLGAVYGLELACDSLLKGDDIYLSSIQRKLFEDDELLMYSWQADWRNLDLTASATKIISITAILSNLFVDIQKSNSIGELMTEFEKAQLISLLKTTIKLFEAPTVEVGFLQRTVEKMQSLFSKSASKHVEDSISAGLLKGQEALSDLIVEIVKNPPL